MTGKTDENKLINRYLLGELSEDELAQIEERYFADEDFFARIVDAENSLVDSYARGDFSAVERGKFEKQFLTTPQRRQKVKFAQSLSRAVAAAQTDAAASAVLNERRAADKQGAAWWQSLVGFFNFQSLTLAFGMAALLLMITGVGLFIILQRGNNLSDIAKLEPPADVPVLLQNNQPSNIDQNAGNFNESIGTNSSPQKSANVQSEQEPVQQKSRNEKQSGDTTARPQKQADNSNSRPEKLNPPPSQPFIATIVLLSGLVRGEGERTQITIPPQASQIRLQINLEENEYSRYRATLQNPDGAEVWSGRAQKTKKGSKTVTALVPARVLAKGDYTLILKGETAEGETENVREYPLSVIKK